MKKLMTITEAMDGIDSNLHEAVSEWYQGLSDAGQRNVSQFDIIILTMSLHNSAVDMEDQMKARGVAEYIAQGDTGEDPEVCDV